MDISPALPLPFAGLAPEPVWRHFATLCAIPRPSKHEAALRDHLVAWAAARGLASEQDDAGNLLLRKAGSPGREHEADVILQGHLDMVCQKNGGTAHDFDKDPIRPLLQDGWLVAPDTTLGADNGLGVALALAVLEADDLSHPPLEVLLTVDEEAGMGGALGLRPGWLRGSRLINLDTEEWGHFYLGCAGGLDVNVDWTLATEPAPASWRTVRLEVSGLQGGHSGIDIDKGRGNAIKLLGRLLRELADAHPGAFRLIDIDGGTARNALAREAGATIAANPASMADFQATLAARAAVLGREYAGVEARLAAQLTVLPEASPVPVLTAAAQAQLLAALNAAPHGVARMSPHVAGVVETSNNLGMLTLATGRVRANFMVRSLVDSAALAHARAIADLFALPGPGCRVSTGDSYPGWRPNPDSPLLALAQQVFAREFPEDQDGGARVEVIHAGLECGIIGAAYPDLDMLSFGPTIRGAHAPGERVEVTSVAKCWQLLTALLAALPQR